MALSVGFIGVGNMGNPMAGNILKAPFPMTVFDTNPKAMENLVTAGAKRAGSAREVVDHSEIVLTSLPASPDVEAMYLGPGGLVESAKPGTILIDLSSVLPSTPKKIEPVAKKRGVHFLEAPSAAGSAALVPPRSRSWSAARPSHCRARAPSSSPWGPTSSTSARSGRAIR